MIAPFVRVARNTIEHRAGACIARTAAAYTLHMNELPVLKIDKYFDPVATQVMPLLLGAIAISFAVGIARGRVHRCRRRG